MEQEKEKVTPEQEGKGLVIEIETEEVKTDKLGQSYAGFTARIIQANETTELKGRWKFVDVVDGFPNSEDKLKHNVFEISLRHSEVRRSFKFYGSNRDLELGKEELDRSDIIDAVRCLFEDALYADNTFEEFCSELGYSEDSIKAFKIYKACIRQLSKVLDLGFYRVDLPDIINALQELEE